MQPAILVHGGVGEPLDVTDGCQKAAEAGIDALCRGDTALDAAVAAIVVLEDDGRFNAGSGAMPGLDGFTIAMEAGLMDSQGHLAAVFALHQVKNPILVARKLADTPHVFLAAEGAITFARKMGFMPYYHLSETARKSHAEAFEQLSQGQVSPPQWSDFDWEAYWNYEVSLNDVRNRNKHGTVGAVARDSNGHFAACASTGGSNPMLLGRVGDSALVGCGFYCGEKGAIAATGIGEYAIRQTLCSRVYAWLEIGMPLQEALDKGIALFPQEIDMGLIGITADEIASSANKQMPTCNVAT